MATPTPKHSHYDVVIIGAGMAGLAASIRLAHFGRKVCLLDRHYCVGGLNSFYVLGRRKYDVGLHAMTNYVSPGVKGTPLVKLLRQLRISREELDLCPQWGSRVAFPGCELRFANDFGVLEEDVAARFPKQIDGFRSLVGVVREYDELALRNEEISAREVVGRHISDPLLTDMLFCPLMFYGSARERDMDFYQFVIMFKALFLEGLARPFHGVRQVIRVLMPKLRQSGVERVMPCGVREIQIRDRRVSRLILDDGNTITADHVLSTAGSAETQRMLQPEPGGSETEPGRLTFVEMMKVLSCQPRDLGWKDTIVFFNDSERFDYSSPREPVDTRSGVICFSNNFDFGQRKLNEGIFRVTCLANYDRWAALSEDEYQASKQTWFSRAFHAARAFLPPVPDATLDGVTVATDMFTPRTIRRFTGHFNGAVYGSPRKNKTGRTEVENLYLCGTDQGFLGIVGAMLSGISMANAHVLSK